MRSFAGMILALVLAGCSSAAPTAPATAPTVAPSTTVAPPTPPSSAPSTTPSAPATSPAGLLGMPSSALRAAAEAQGLRFQPVAGADLPMTLGRVPDGTGALLLVGDPVIAVGWKVAAPMMDNGPLHGLLAALGREDVTTWKDGHLPMLMSGTGGQATGDVAGMALLLVLRDPGLETETMALVMGDPAALAGGMEIPIAAASPSPPPEGLAESMRRYANGAAALNGVLALRLAVVLDPAADASARRLAAGRARDAERAFAEAVRSLPVPADLAGGASSLAEASDAVGAALATCSAASGKGAIDAALPALLAALDAASGRAEAFRSSLLAQPIGVPELSSDPVPPPVVMAGPIAAPGSLEIAGYALTSNQGSGDLGVSLSNPTAAFALGVTVKVRLYAYDGSLVSTETLGADVLPPSSLVTLAKPIASAPGAAAPQRAEVLTLAVETWRAARVPEVRGR